MSCAPQKGRRIRDESIHRTLLRQPPRPLGAMVLPTWDRRVQRRWAARLVDAAFAARACDRKTAGLLRLHAKEASAALAVLSMCALGRRLRHESLKRYADALAAGEHLGVFVRRERWNRIRLCDGRRCRHPSVRWGPGIFPEVRCKALDQLVTPASLQKAIKLAIAVILEEQHTIRLAFRIVAAHAHGGRSPSAVWMDTTRAVARLRRVVLGLEEVSSADGSRSFRDAPNPVPPRRTQENPARIGASGYRRSEVEIICGESLPHTIWISSTAPMSFEELLNTLVHEALHHSVLVDGELLSCEEEHHAMFLLGDVTSTGVLYPYP